MPLPLPSPLPNPLPFPFPSPFPFRETLIIACCVALLCAPAAALAQVEPGEVSDGKISEPALSPALVTDNFPVKAAYERGWSRGFGAAAITSLVLYLRSDRVEEPPPVSVGFSPLPGGGAVSGGFRF